MAGARVQSIDALKHFRVALIKFAESANVSMGDADSEVQRTASWLAGSQQQYWETQIRKRHEFVNRCKDAVRQKKLFKDSTGRTQSAVDEEKALQKAMKALTEAEEKLVATKRHSIKMQRELHMYKGAVQAFGTCVASDIPNAIATLDRMIHKLEEYVALTSGAGSAAPSEAGSMAGIGSGESNAMTRAEMEAAVNEKIEQKNDEIFINGARVVATDINTANGIIHVIDTVIVP